VKINQAAFIIADVTGRNPNVMYELGIAHTLGKPVIIITQEINKIPFDFKHLRHYVYEDNVTGKELFGRLLKEVIPEIYAETYPNARISFE
jgi:nucleoside 2-deoxyribosyltransferase